MQQKIFIEPIFRQPTNEECLNVRDCLDSEFIANASHKKIGYGFSVFFIILGVMFLFTALCEVAEIILFLLMFVISVLFFTLGITGIRNEKQYENDLCSLRKDSFVISENDAVNLRIVPKAAPDGGYVDVAYVDIATSDNNIIVQNVMMPINPAMVLYNQGVSNFRCLLVKIDCKKELIAVPIS